MFELTVQSDFSAAHRLREYRGKCEALHGHNWKITARLCSEKLNNSGIVMDFREIKNKLKNVLNKLDHSYLNQLPYFKKNNPTSENIAKYIYTQLSSRINKKEITLKQVSVWETETSKVTYYK